MIDASEDRPIDFPSLPVMDLARAQASADVDDADSLRDRLLATAGRLVGAPEREDFLRRLARARPYRLSPRACTALAVSLERDADGLEQNVDLIRLPEEGLWFEFAESDLSRGALTDLGEGRRRPLNVGVLVAPDPDDEDRFVVMCSWEFEPHFGMRRDALVRHGYGVIAFSMATLAEHAFLARSGRLESEKPAAARLLDLSIGYVPPGFRDEALVTSDIDPNDETAVKRLVASFLYDVAAEVPLALAVSLLLSTKASANVTGEGAGKLPTLDVPTSIGRQVMGWAWGTGFRRGGTARAPSVRFIPLRA